MRFALTPGPLFETPRSGRWPAVRDQHLASHPECAACGSDRNLTVHHVVPVSADEARELDPANLITLCEGAPGLNCHLYLGHLGHWASWNRHVRADAAWYLARLAARPEPWRG